MPTQIKLKDTYVIILAGGLGSRLGSLTKNNPKSLIKINKIPFIIIQLKKVDKCGFRNVILCLSHYSDQIIEKISKHEFKLDIIFSFDGKIRLGTGGAVKNAIKKKCSNFFFVVYGDVFFNLKFNEILKIFLKEKKKIDSLMVVFKSKLHYEEGNVTFKKNSMIKYDKFNKISNMEFIDYGVSIFKRSTFLNEKKKIFDLATVQKKLSNKKKLIGYISKYQSYEIGSYTGIKQVNKLTNITEVIKNYALYKKLS